MILSRGSRSQIHVCQIWRVFCQTAENLFETDWFPESISDFLQVIEITSQIRKTDSKFSQQEEMAWLDSSFQKQVQAADEGEEILWTVIMCISFDAHSACLVGHSKAQI